MTAGRRRAAIVAVLGTAGFVVGFVFAPSERRAAAAAFLLLLGILGLILAAGRLRTEAPASRGSLFTRRAPSVRRLPGLRRRRRPTEIELLEGRLLTAARNAADFHMRLRPILREIATARLARRHGVSLDRDVAAARALLGEELWEVVRPDRPEPLDRTAPGPGLEALGPLVMRLEEVG